VSRNENIADAKRWLNASQTDMDVAIMLKDAGMFPHACFNAQQSAEKAVRALLYFYDKESRGHSIVKLLENLEEADTVSSSISSIAEMLLKNARLLDKLYIPTRYPDGLPDGLIPADVFTLEDAQNAVNAALEIIKAITKITES